MPEIKFSVEKAERWLERIEKRLGALTPEDGATYTRLREAHASGRKLDWQEARDLWALGKKL